MNTVKYFQARKIIKHENRLPREIMVLYSSLDPTGKKKKQKPMQSALSRSDGRFPTSPVIQNIL